MNTNKQHLEKMHRILKDFAAQLEKLAAEAVKNEEIYQAKIAADQNALLREKMATLRDNTYAAITAEAEAACADVITWSEPKGSDLTADYELLKGAVNLSPEDLQLLAYRYRDNATMLRALAKYAEGRSDVDLRVLTPADRLNAWRNIESGAYSLLDSIYEQPAGGPMIDLAVEVWGDPEQQAGMQQYALMFE